MQSAARKLALSGPPSRLVSRVCIESYCVLNRSKRTWCQRSFSASVQSNSSNGKSTRRRVSKEERRAMVEAFILRYMASNGGKFPSITHARLEVGGSHYTIRQIIQEMQYNHKLAPLKTITKVRVNDLEEVICPSLNAEEEFVEHGTGSREEAIRNDLTESQDDATGVAETKTEFLHASPPDMIHVKEESVEHGTRTCEEANDGVNLNEDSVIRHDEVTGLFDAKEAVSSSDSVIGYVEGPKSHLTADIDHSSEETEEGVSGQKVSDTNVNVDIMLNDARQLLTEKSEVTEHDSTKSQVDAIGVAETKIEALHASPPETQAAKEDTKSTVFVQESIDVKEGRERSIEKASVPEEVASDNAKASDESSSSSERSSIWGNLKSLAGGIISFWKKM